MFGLFKRNPYRAPAARLYDQLVRLSRERVFYTEFGVPDTVDGRFEMITLHVFAVLKRVGDETVDPKGAARFGQALFDAMFRDIDYNLREMGVGDLSVPKKMKFMMKSFNGRCYAYGDALISDAALEDAIRRNLYGTVAAPDTKWIQSMAKYLRGICHDLHAVPLDQVISGEFELLCSGSRDEKAA